MTGFTYNYHERQNDMARWTVYLRHTTKGWEWGRKPDWMSHGFYKTKGLAQGAAKRSIPQVVGGKANPKDFEFIEVTPGVGNEI